MRNKLFLVLLASAGFGMVGCSGSEVDPSQTEVKCSETLPCADTVTQYCSKEGVCVAKKGLGVACASAVECLSLNCNAGVCAASSSSSSSTVPSGAECSQTQACADTTKYCDFNNQKCLLKKADGYLCGMANECTSNYCNSQNRCGKEPSATPECSTTQNCTDTNKYCDVQNQQCLNKKADNQRCEQAVECLSNQCNSQKRCGAQSSADPSEFAECTATQGCTDTTKYCDLLNQICLAKKADGQLCEQAVECQSNKCNSQNRCGAETSGTSECSASKSCTYTNKYCDLQNQRCLNKKADNQLCEQAVECLSNKCNSQNRCGDEPAVTPECSATKSCTDTNQYCDLQNQRCLNKKADNPLCEQAVECLSNTCNSQNRCGDEPSVTSECSATQPCADANKYCDVENQRCLAKKADGQSCQDAKECVSAKCNSKNQCGEEQSAESCASSLLCDSNTRYCDSTDKICKDKKADGQNCTEHKECINNFCGSDQRCGKITISSNTCGGDADCDITKERCDGGVCKRLSISDVEYNDCDDPGKTFCTSDGYLVRCMNGANSTSLIKTDCANASKVCVESEGVAICASTCDQENATSTICDTDDETVEIQLQCKKINGSLFYIAVGEKICEGMMTCMSWETHCSF